MRRQAAAVAAGAATYGAWAVVGSHWLHPHLTRNADEATYLQQAAALASGHLTMAPPGDARTFQPWFAVVRDGRYVFKYTPVWPAVLAAARTLGSARIALFVAAAAAFVGTYLLAREVLTSHRRALVAAVLFAIAPLSWFLAATFLSYVWFSALWTFTAWAVLRAARTRGPGLPLAAGALAGFSFFARPFDAILVLAPFGAWLVWDGRHAWGALARRVGWIVLGAVVPAGLFLATNAALTGSPFRTTLTLWDPLDRLGFGPRRILGAGPPQVDFTVRDGLVGMVKHIWLLQWWSAGGIVVAALAVYGLVVSSRRRGVVPLAAVAVVVPIGFVAYWGPYSITSLEVRFAHDFGPFYVLPLLVPVSILAVEGIASLRTRSTAFTAVVVALLVAIFGVNVARTLHRNLAARDARNRHYVALESLPSTRTLVFVPTWSHYLGTGPNGALVNEERNPRTLYADAVNPATTVAAVTAFPDRAPYRLVRRGATTRLVPLHLRSVPSLPLTVDVVDTQGATSAVVDVASGSQVYSVPLSADALRTRRATLRVVVGPDEVTVDGVPVAGALRDPATIGALSVTVRLEGIPGDAPGQVRQYKWRMPEQVRADGLTLVTPATTKRTLGTPGERIVRTNIDDVVRVSTR